ncbi:MAG TPA: hypothetical protein VEX41_11290, partial [Candidatus Eisenbacteria bacterium]|nr:hypothetical protein [Candidatus Eisenbacteria bacterium]
DATAAGPTVARETTEPWPTEAAWTEDSDGGQIPLPVSDPQFVVSSTEACQQRRPSNVYDITSPAAPGTAVPGYHGLHIAVLEMRGPDGTDGLPPELPPGDTYYQVSSSTAQSDLWRVRATDESQVDLVACVVMRAGRSNDYTIGSRTVEVTALDAIVWMLDWRSQSLVGGPWAAEAELPFLVDADDLLPVGSAKLLPADVFGGLLAFMGLAGASPGSAYQGGATGWVVAEYDKPADLPPGTELLPGYTFVVRLVVLDDPATIDFIDVLCAPSGRIAATPLRVATGVGVELGAFGAASADIRISGTFTSSIFVAGQIQAQTSSARDCGIPGSSDWQASLAVSARPSGGDYELYMPGQP